MATKQDKIRGREQKRKNIIDSMLRTDIFLKSYTEDRGHELNTRLDRLEKMWYNFEEVQDELDRLNIEHDNTENERKRAEIEELYVSMKSGLLRLMPLTNKVVTDNAKPISVVSKVKLPIIQLPEFKGDFQDWLTFHDTFLSLIDKSVELSAVQKLHYLKAALKGEAARLIEPIQTTEENYSIAWQVLVSRYGNKVLLKKKHIQAILKLPKMSNSGLESLKQTIDEFKRHTLILEQLGEPIKHLSSFLIELLCDKLDNDSLKACEEAQSDKRFIFDEMIEFLHKRMHLLETIATDRNTVEMNKRSQRVKLSVNATSAVKKIENCVVCGKEGHAIVNCQRFSESDCKERQNMVRQKRLCWNCLETGHFSSNCSSRYGCRKCDKRHHTLLHSERYASERSDNISRSVSGMVLTNIPLKTNPAEEFSYTNTLLTTVVVFVVDAYGKEHPIRALLDNGAQPNAISERLCQLLCLKQRRIHVPITGIDGTITSASCEVNAEIRSRFNEYAVRLNFLVLGKVTANTPGSSFSTTNWKLPTDLPLADPTFNCTERVDMLLGASHYYKFLKEGRFKLCDQGVMLVETVFGWVVTGEVLQKEAIEELPAAACHLMLSTQNISKQLERFWNIEEMQMVHRTPDEQMCEEYFEQTTLRDESGRYVVKMPKHPEYLQMIGDSKTTSLKRFAALEQRLLKDPNLRKHYSDFMLEYIQLGHMKAVLPENEDIWPSCYLPHHPVFKESSSTTKIRVVFDGSAATSTGYSLNDALLVGPVVQNDLLSLVMRFRKFQVALVADLEKMYRQVLVNPEDRPLQRILWRFEDSQPIETYELRTVTYGLAPSSFLATRTILQLAEDEGDAFPVARESLKGQLYVDDLITGADNVEDAIQLRNELSTLVQKGGFTFRKWCSNSLAVLADLPPELLGTKSALRFDDKETIKTLGISWEPESDMFCFNVSITTNAEPDTMRSILSVIAQLYDPLGIISPVIVKAKVLMQSLWRLKLKWDDIVPDTIQREWHSFRAQLPELQKFRIPRFVFCIGFVKAEIHCFTDASERAYGACIYIRSETSDGKIQVNLLASKSRVAPLKVLSIPRLELCGALLGARLHGKVIDALNISFAANYFWTDSTVVLDWLKAEPLKWKTFVANRVAEIQATTRAEWRHILGQENPADLVSRGMLPHQLINNKLWKYGPPWLMKERDNWPKQKGGTNPTTNDELRSNVILTAKLREPNTIFTRYGSYERLINVIGYCYRFIHNARNIQPRIHSTVLTVAERSLVKKKLLQLVQAEEFTQDFKNLRKGIPVSRGSTLKLLSPFIDTDGLIRVGGRLKQSQLPYDSKHPVVLPGFHPFTQLLMTNKHRQLMHGGISSTLNAVRDEVWPINGRRAVRRVIRNCFRCCRANPQPMLQPEGQLPVDRVTVSEVFKCTGVDYCGPLFLKPIHRRASPSKCYVCVFVCMSTKAVHLELVGDLSTTTFLMALDRFIYRRGKPSNIYSDNGTNFIGAKNELHHVYEMLNNATDADRICTHLAKEEIQWHLIPPRAPNFGGLWEAAVKVAKGHLIRQLGSSRLSVEEMTTVLVKIEGCMNSRPLCPISDDPNDLATLTPAHFLIRNKLEVLPEPHLLNIPLNRLGRYQLLQRYTQNFWRQWSQDYVKHLTVMHRANQQPSRISIGDIVILKDEQLPTVQWPLARVIEIHPGPDGVARVATLRTASTTIKRAVNKICPLECAYERQD